MSPKIGRSCESLRAAVRRSTRNRVRTDEDRRPHPRKRFRVERAGPGKKMRGGFRTMAARLKERYQKEIAPAIAKEFGIENPMAIPRLEKIVINMGLGEAISNAKIVDTGADELRAVTGQKPVTTRAKKSIASFKLRQGMPIGTMVTLRGDRMYEFFDRLVSIALPRVRDFR